MTQPQTRGASDCQVGKTFTTEEVGSFPSTSFGLLSEVPTPRTQGKELASRHGMLHSRSLTACDGFFSIQRGIILGNRKKPPRA